VRDGLNPVEASRHEGAIPDIANDELRGLAEVGRPCRGPPSARRSVDLRIEVVEHQDVVTVAYEAIDKVGTDEAGTPGH
jgi:hypothetical protein